MDMFSSKLALVGAVAALSLASAAPASAQRVVVFGDSLSDTGNLTALSGGALPGPAYPKGRFSSGLVWIDQLYGPTTLFYPGKTAITGNVDLAIGGARTDFSTPVPGTPLTIFGIPQQITDFAKAGGTFGARDTVVLWGGANNIFQYVNSTNPALLSPNASTLIANNSISAATSLLGSAQTLVVQGARTLIVPNLPDFGSLPQYIASGSTGASAGSLASSVFNQALATGLGSIKAASPSLNIIQADIASAFRIVVANPGAFGFSNVTQQCLNTTTGVACANPKTFLFWDGVHPTEAGYALVATYVGALSNTTPALLQQARLSESQIYANEQITNAVYGRLTNFISGTYADKNGPYIELLGTYGTYDASSGRPELTLQLGGFRAGIDKKSGASLTGASIGVMDGSMSAGGLTSDLITYRFDVYGTALFGNAFISADAGIAGSSYSGITRETGFPTVRAKGETSGYVATVSAEAGFAQQVGNFTIIPSGRVTYLHAQLDGYDEQADLLAMSFADRQTDAVLLGGRVRAVTAVPGLGISSTGFGEIGYEAYVSSSNDGVKSTFLNNTALPTVANADLTGPGIVGKLGVSSQVTQGTFLDFQYGISVHDSGGQTHSGDIRLKSTY